MHPERQAEHVANAAAEEVLRVIWGDDLTGCTVSVDQVATVVRAALQEQAGAFRDVAELHQKGFEAVQLLSTPPLDGQALTPEDLRSLLGERLDQIRALATKILEATGSGINPKPNESDRPGATR